MPTRPNRLGSGTKHFRKHENGVYAFKPNGETFSPLPLPAQARAAYAEQVERARQDQFFEGWTFRLIIGGEVEAEETPLQTTGR